MKRFPLYLVPFLILAISVAFAADPTPQASPASNASTTPAAIASTTPLPRPSGPPTSTIPSDANWVRNLGRQSSMEDHFAANKPENIDLIFIGDSITEGWHWGWGRPVWEKFYAGRAIDFGVSADRTEHVLWRLDHLGVKRFHPKVAVIMIGTNNWDPASTPEDIAAGVKAVIAKTQECFPGVKILLTSILPNARATEKMAAANLLIKSFADGDSIRYVDLASKFTPEGDNWKGLLKDKLHPTTQGYEVWAAEINPLINQISPK